MKNIDFDAIGNDEGVTVEMACCVIGGKHSPISRPTYYRGVKAGIFPPPYHPAPGCSRVNMGKLREAIAKARAAVGEAA